MKGEKQRIETHRGCPKGHEYCLEPQINVDFPIPVLTKNYVQILDMNFLCRKDVLETIRYLGSLTVNGKRTLFEVVCGFHFQLLSEEIALALKRSHFIKPRLAWDGPLTEQYDLKHAINLLVKSGYRRSDIMLFVIVNWKVPRVECEKKLDLMKVWNVKVCDCCYDGGYKYATPSFWKGRDLKEFRSKCRTHNLLVNFRIYPKLPRSRFH